MANSDSYLFLYDFLFLKISLQLWWVEEGVNLIPLSNSIFGFQRDGRGTLPLRAAHWCWAHHTAIFLVL